MQPKQRSLLKCAKAFLASAGCFSRLESVEIMGLSLRSQHVLGAALVAICAMGGALASVVATLDASVLGEGVASVKMVGAGENLETDEEGAEAEAQLGASALMAKIEKEARAEKASGNQKPASDGVYMKKASDAEQKLAARTTTAKPQAAPAKVIGKVTKSMVARNIAERRVRHRFAKVHPTAVARIARQQRRALRKLKQPPKPASPSSGGSESYEYKPFVDQPELAPRFDRDGIHRDVLARSERFVPRTGYRPRDELEKSQVNMKDEDALDEAERTAGNTLKRTAEMDQLRTKFEQEEKAVEVHRKQNKAKLAYMLDQETAKLTRQRPEYSPVREGVAEKQIIASQLKSVLAEVNPVATKIIRRVLQYDAGYREKQRVTSESIKKMSKAKITNSSSEAFKIIHRAQEDAAEEKEGAQAVARAKHAAQRIRQKARARGFKEAAAIRKALLLKRLKLGGNFTKTKSSAAPAIKMDGRGLLIPPAKKVKNV